MGRIGKQNLKHMNMEYKEFLQTKQKNHIVSGFDVAQSDLNSNLFPFQRFIVDRALRAQWHYQRGGNI